LTKNAPYKDEKRRPWRMVVAPNPDRCKRPMTVPRAAIVARPDCIRLRLGPDVPLVGVLLPELCSDAKRRSVPIPDMALVPQRCRLSPSG
jgi:hypothetical protein